MKHCVNAYLSLMELPYLRWRLHWLECESNQKTDRPIQPQILKTKSIMVIKDVLLFFPLKKLPDKLMISFSSNI